MVQRRTAFRTLGADLHQRDVMVGIPCREEGHRSLAEVSSGDLGQAKHSAIEGNSSLEIVDPQNNVADLRHRNGHGVLLRMAAGGGRAASKATVLVESEVRVTEAICPNPAIPSRERAHRAISHKLLTDGAGGTTRRAVRRSVSATRSTPAH